MKTNKITPHITRKVAKVFRIGARNMFSAMKLSSGDGSAGFQIAFNRFFRNVLLRFGTGWRPDVFGSSVVLGMYAGAQLRSPTQSMVGQKNMDVNFESSRGNVSVVGSRSAHGNAAVLECGFSSWDGGGMGESFEKHFDGNDNDDFDDDHAQNRYRPSHHYSSSNS